MLLLASALRIGPLSEISNVIKDLSSAFSTLIYFEKNDGLMVRKDESLAK